MKLPPLVKGQVVPYNVQEKQLQDERENSRRKIQYRHDWLIAIFSVVGGGIMGFLTSLIFWICTK